MCGNESTVGVAVAADDKVLATGEHWNVTAVDWLEAADALVGLWKLSLAENTMRRKFRIIIEQNTLVKYKCGGALASWG